MSLPQFSFFVGHPFPFVSLTTEGIPPSSGTFPISRLQFCRAYLLRTSMTKSGFGAHYHLIRICPFQIRQLENPGCRGGIMVASAVDYLNGSQQQRHRIRVASEMAARSTEKYCIPPTKILHSAHSYSDRISACDAPRKQQAKSLDSEIRAAHTEAPSGDMSGTSNHVTSPRV
jgi:hypothetical protein